MKYYKSEKVNNVHIIEMPISDFKIILNDSKKKSALPRNYCNAGFFANYSENGQPFTLPVAHLVCDYGATSSATKKYCTERGKFNGNKFTFDSSTWSYGNDFYKKAISTLLIKDNKAEIKEIISIPTGYNYAISGIPVMKNGVDVSYNNFVKTQGWDASPLYATWHIFIGLKQNDNNTIYIIGMQTTTYNLIATSEAYQKFKKLDMYNVIKLDGGGSFHLNVDGKTIATAFEDRRINTIISFDNCNIGGKVDNAIENEIDKKDNVQNSNVTNNVSNVTINTANTINTNKSITKSIFKNFTSSNNVLTSFIRRKRKYI